MTPQLAAAHTYLDRGISVLPLQHDNKAPMGRWRTFQHRHMPRETAEMWWGGHFKPTPGIGIVCGAISSGLTVLDVEPEHVAFVTDAVRLPDTPRARTARGGLHVYCRTDALLRNGKLAIDGRIVGDRRTTGGYVVGPPSVMAAGVYEWATPSDWAMTDLADLPAWANPPRTTNATAPHPVLTARFGATPGELVVDLPSKIQLMVQDPRVHHSERDFWVMREAIFLGASYEDAEALFLHTALSANVLRHEIEKGSGSYLETTYRNALASVERDVAQAHVVRVHRIVIADALGASREGPTARKRALVEVFRPCQSELYRYAVPVVLGDGSISGEWRAFARAFGLDPEMPSCVRPKTRARAVLWQDRVVRFLDPGVWTSDR